jgi:hypothetical protein
LTTAPAARNACTGAASASTAQGFGTVAKGASSGAADSSPVTSQTPPAATITRAHHAQRGESGRPVGVR